MKLTIQMLEGIKNLSDEEIRADDSLDYVREMAEKLIKMNKAGNDFFVECEDVSSHKYLKENWAAVCIG